MSGYQIVALADLDRIAVSGSPVMHPVRYALGVSAFGVNAFTGDKVGDVVVERHREDGGPEELYAVVSGRATFTLDEETLDAPAGTLVHALPEQLRQAVAAEPGTTVLAVGADPGKVFRPSGWEAFHIANGYRLAGDIAAGRSAIRASLDGDPAPWASHYNAACFEALAGDTDAAFVHLRHAVARNAAKVRGLAPTDADLDSLRDDPRFAEVGG